MANCAKRTLPLLLRKASSNWTPRTSVPAVRIYQARTNPTVSTRQQQQRYLSASASKKTKRSRKIHNSKSINNQTAEPPEPKPVPRWATTASVLVVPFMFAAWGVSDWMFGNRNKGHNEDLRQLFLQDMRKKLHQDDDDDAWLNELDQAPTVLHCVIRKNSGLTHCLSGVRLGDVVEVLEEGVGPNRDYNLCRLPAKEGSMSRDTYGWFPIRWLQKLDHYQAIAREQELQNLSSKDNSAN